MSQISKAMDIARKKGNFDESSIQKYDGQIEKLDLANLKGIKINEQTLRQNRVLTVLDDELVIDTYRLLRTRVLKRMRQNNWKCLGVTSAGKDDGKSLTALNLGISIAMKQNFSVVVVDADLRNPCIHNMFGFKPHAGIEDYLTTNVPIDEILVNPGIERLSILPGHGRTKASSELLSSPKMARLVKDLKTRFPNRIVIFDLPPVLVGDDVVAFAPNLDAALLVVEEGSTESDKLKKTIELLEDVEIIGTVLNKSKDSSQSQEYY